MKRRSLSKTLLSKKELSIDDAWRWYVFQLRLVEEEQGRVFTALESRVEIFDPRYYGKRAAELAQEFDFQIFELNNCAKLAFLSSTEAALNIDFVVRVQNRWKDAVSRAFRIAQKNAGTNGVY